jgi:hypothetical protein
MRFQVFMVMSKTMMVFWDVTPCSLIEIDKHFKGAYCLCH